MAFEEGDVVFCTVDRIVGTNVFVKISEKDKEVEGCIVMSEIAPGRIRNIRDYVVPKKKIVCKVLRISGDRIDLSLRRVGTGIMLNKLKGYKQEEKAEKLIENIGKEFNYDLKKIYSEFGNNAIEKYGGIVPDKNDDDKNICVSCNENIATVKKDMIFCYYCESS